MIVKSTHCTHTRVQGIERAIPLKTLFIKQAVLIMNSYFDFTAQN